MFSNSLIFSVVNVLYYFIEGNLTEEIIYFKNDLLSFENLQTIVHRFIGFHIGFYIDYHILSFTIIMPKGYIYIEKYGVSYEVYMFIM